VVYTSFLKKNSATTYQPGLNHLLSTNGTIYFFTDNLHTWITDPFIPKNEEILLSIRTQQGKNVNVALAPKLITNFERKAKGRQTNCTLWRIDGYRII
jgi:hypothetical protein